MNRQIRTLVARLTGRQTHTTPATEETTVSDNTANTPAHDDMIMHFRTLGGAPVELYRHQWTERWPATSQTPARTFNYSGFQWECTGCDSFGGPGLFSYEKHKGYDEREPLKSRDAANAHAGSCHSMPKPDGAR